MERRKSFKRETAEEKGYKVKKTKQIEINISGARSQRVKRNAEVSTMMRAMTSEFVVPESSEEKRLWKERGLLEVQIEKKEKMIRNTRERLKAGRGVQGRQTLCDEADEIQREIDELREEITFADREIRAAERNGSKEREGATATESRAREAKECAHELVQARMRMAASVWTVSELEGKLEGLGKV